ncbi:hypothetical protein TNCV_4295651 [Trichonephila clavipes]|nr:hypothetical protein TNCV_4295651 [Trichonephila clavipes]
MEEENHKNANFSDFQTGSMLILSSTSKTSLQRQRMKFDFQLKMKKDDRLSVIVCFDEYDVSAKSFNQSRSLRVVGRLEGGQAQAEVAQAIECHKV